MSTRTSHADLNWLSCSNNVWGLNEGSDHAQILDKQPDPLQLMPDGATGYDAILKVCDGTSGLNLTGLKVAQGMENAVDCNALAHDCTFEGDFGVGGGQGDQVITVKGGCSKLTFGGTIQSNGKVAEVVVGAWSDQSFNVSADLDFSGLKRADGQPVTFVFARCKNVKLPPRAKMFRLKSLLYEIYWYVKYVAVKLNIIKSL